MFFHNNLNVIVLILVFSSVLVGKSCMSFVRWDFLQSYRNFCDNPSLNTGIISCTVELFGKNILFKKVFCECF